MNRRIPLLAAVLLPLTLVSPFPGTSALAATADPPVPHRPPASHFSTKIDNPWMPMRPGTQWRFRTRTPDGTERTVVTVLHRTKMVAGVRTVVVHDVTRLHGKLLENTFDWYAQDRRGRVWYFGENTTAYDGGRPSKAGSWKTGVHGARAGIVMLAHPFVGAAYRQEYRKGVAEDQARVRSLDGRADVPFGRMRGLLKTRDFSRLEPTGDENKFYAKGVGVVLEDALHEKDRTVLVRMTWK